MMAPNKPLLIYDGTCDFCRLWIDRWKVMTQDRIEYEPYQHVAAQFPEVPEETFRHAVQFVEGGTMYSGAEAVFRSLSGVPGKKWMYRMYQRLPGIAAVSDLCYRFVARHRNGFLILTKTLWGKNLEPSSYRLTHWVFFRLMAIIYLVAFFSLAVQVKGLIGADGISPAGNYLHLIQDRVGSAGYWHYPTLMWLNHSDIFLQSVCWAGVGVSILLLIGIAPVVASALLWIMYLSLFVVGQEFLSFQWDILLLETGFLAIFFAQNELFSTLSRTKEPPALVRLLLKLLLFRLMFFSGFVKLASGDRSWWNLSALTFHYETQPLPTPAAWYIHHLPVWFHTISCAVMFIIELVLPFFIFAPRRLRMISCSFIALLMIIIMVTGNYTFFNLLALALCMVLLDDRVLKNVFPKKFQRPIIHTPSSSIFKKIVLGTLAVTIISLNGIKFAELIFPRNEMPNPIERISGWFSRVYIVNRYGLFAVMTNPRYEIIIEGSNDGNTWLPYEFKYKPGDVTRAPSWVEPHQPRLDWQMWFAALGSYEQNPWFVNLCVRLLQGSRDVLDLLQTNPFPGQPPRYIRALVYEYHFSDETTRYDTGAWWKRDLMGSYLQPISLRK